MAGHDEIVGILGSEILSGERQPGSRMPTAEELFERFGASRVLMREITKTLVAKGMIAAKSRVGTLVLPPDHWNWFDPDVLAWRVSLGLDTAFFEHLSHMRRAVEPAAAALAAERRTPDDVVAIRRALSAMSRAGIDRNAFARADLAFHVAVAAASGNPLYRSFAGVIETALAASFTLSAPMQSAALLAIVAQHALIAEAIDHGDPVAAGDAMRAVIDQGADRVAMQTA